MPDTWTTAQLAKEVTRRGKKMSGAWIRHLCQTGRIKATKPGRDWLVQEDEAQRWIAEWTKSK